MEERPIEVGQVFAVEITGLGHSGEGVGRVNDFVVFVPGAFPGDVVETAIEEVGTNYCRGRVVRILEKSAERTDPVCGSYSECGGCQLQHASYASQLRWKKKTVEDAIRRIGGLSGVEIRDTLGMTNPWNYRNKAQYPVGRLHGKLVLGFFKRGTHEIVDAVDCRIQHPLSNRIASVFREHVQEFAPIVYDEVTGEGLLRHLVTRVSVRRNEAMAILIVTQTGGEHWRQISEMADLLKGTVPEIVSIAVNLNPRKTNVIFGSETRIVSGRDHIIEELGGLSFAISPRSFFQVNTPQAEVLYGVAAEFAGLSGEESVLDCYCGTGTIALFLSKRGAKTVLGIEEVEDAVSDARRNARMNGVEDIRFEVGKVEEILPEIVGGSKRANRVAPFDVAVLDPPRKGCDRRVLEALAQSRIRRIVYVSCNPATLARDLRQLAGMGYRTTTIQPVDMFPQTSHIECVALMPRVK